MNTTNSNLRHHDQDLVFDHLPPFPDNVTTAPLLRLSLAKLVAQDATELDNLWRACCDLGFFYLDLRDAPPPPRRTPVTDIDENGERRDSVQQPPLNGKGPLSVEQLQDGNGLLSTASALFKLGQDVFALSEDEKTRYDFKDQGSYFGYKGLGAGVVDAKGTRDANEFYNISKDDILGTGDRWPAPDLLQDQGNRRELEAFMRGCHGIVSLILGVLNRRLDLPDGTLPGLHRLEGVSGDQVRFVRAPPKEGVEAEGQMKLGEHTDFGSVTVLFNQLGGLQVLPPPGVGDTVGWCYVKPLKGHCVINLGDAMVKFTSGILKSNLHRVVAPPGEQAKETRMSLVYFARPEDAVMLKALEGSDLIDKKRATKVEFKGEEVICAKEWILRRAMGRRTGGDFKGSMGTEAGRIKT